MNLFGIKFYEAQVKYERTGAKGTPEKVRENYVTQSVSMTDCETTLTQELSPFALGQVTLMNAKVTKYSEFLKYDELISKVDTKAKQLLGQKSENSDEELRYFSVKVSFITLDEDSGKEKKTANMLLVESTSVDAVTEQVTQHMKGTMADWEINNIVETKIVSVLLTDKRN